jgi:hypothetical protein
MTALTGHLIYGRRKINKYTHNITYIKQGLIGGLRVKPNYKLNFNNTMFVEIRIPYGSELTKPLKSADRSSY